MGDHPRPLNCHRKPQTFIFMNEEIHCSLASSPKPRAGGFIDNLRTQTHLVIFFQLSPLLFIFPPSYTPSHAFYCPTYQFRPDLWSRLLTTFSQPKLPTRQDFLTYQGKESLAFNENLQLAKSLKPSSSWLAFYCH